MTVGIRARHEGTSGSDVTGVPHDDGSKKKERRSKSAERASVEARLGQLELTVADGRLEELEGNLSARSPLRRLRLLARLPWQNSCIPSLNLGLIGSARYYGSSGPTRHGSPRSSALLPCVSSTPAPMVYDCSP